jgi:cytochrome c554/c'-like protein
MLSTLLRLARSNGARALWPRPRGGVRPARPWLRPVLALLVAAACGAGESAPAPVYLSREQLMDPQTCSGCHQKHYAEWSVSMHAHASDDPLFVAMNARGQRENAIGDFCVKCHAPMAVRTGATSDGLNLDTLPASLQGVTCYFCHSVDGVEGTHNNPLRLAEDDVLRGPLADPAENPVHASSYSPLHDRDQLASADMCGSCHDIVNDLGTHLERTFAEWQGTVFSQPLIGTTCGQCHMDQSTDLEPAAPGAVPRRLHDHRFPAVDLPLTSPEDADALRGPVQSFLDTSLQSALCVRGAQGAAELMVVLDNVAAGHAWPSGAAQDRRAWVQLTAYAGDAVVYQSGVVPEGGDVTELDDPDLWLIRDCLLDERGEEVHMFWEASEYESNLLPGQVTFDASDPRYYQSHVFQTYPGGARLPVYPDRVTLQVYLQPVGLDVFGDLVESGDLTDTPTHTLDQLRAGLAPLPVGAELVWTRETATENYVEQGLPVACVSSTNLLGNADKVPAVKHTRCGP